MANFKGVVEEQGGGAYGQVYAIFNMMYAGGTLLGPFVGGVLVDQIGFAWTMVGTGCAVAGLSIVLIYTRLIQLCCCPPSSSSRIGAPK